MTTPLDSGPWVVHLDAGHPRVWVGPEGRVHLESERYHLVFEVEEAERILTALSLWKQNRPGPGWDDDPLND